MSPAPSTDQRVEKWTRWLTGRIGSEVHAMHLHHHVWEHVQTVTAANESLPLSYWWDFMRATYASSQASAVRRMADSHHDAISLRRLLDEVSEDAGRLTREWFIARFGAHPDPTMLQDAEKAWSGFAGGVGKHVDPRVVRTDLDELVAMSERVVAYVDRYVAHADPRGLNPHQMPEFPEIGEAVGCVGRIFQRYAALFTDTRVVLRPALPRSWDRVFDQPWRRPT